MKLKDLGKPIYGTGNLFEWGNDQILKLYGPETPKDVVKQMKAREDWLYELGLPVPKLGELLEIEDSFGQIYEKIDGISMGEQLISFQEDEQKIDDLATSFAEVHFQIHSCSADQMNMHHQKEFFPALIERIDILSPELKETLITKIKELPSGTQICHGDFHPFNLVMSSRGPIVIDWNNSHAGNPLEDVARSRLILAGHSHMHPSLTRTLDQFQAKYLDHYFELAPKSRDEISLWWPTVAAIRFLDNIPELHKWLLAQVKTGIEQ